MNYFYFLHADNIVKCSIELRHLIHNALKGGKWGVECFNTMIPILSDYIAICGR